jgi:HTH-type transcriptional regulator, sugar sensing transcriptional regulator
MNLTLAIQNLGLNEKEAKIYLALLQLGMTTAYNVSIKSGIKKPTTYVILDNLMEKGFVNKIPRSKKQLFIAEAPQKCIEEVKNKLEFTEDALPELLAIKKESDQKVNVSYYEGFRGVKEMYKKMLKNVKEEKGRKEILGFFGHSDGSPQELIEYWDELNKERVKRNINGRGITPNHSDNIKYLKNQKSLLFNLVGIPLEKYDSKVSIEIYNNFVQIVSFRKLQGILIDNADIADALKQVFEMVWVGLEQKSDEKQTIKKERIVKKIKS